MCRSAKCVVLQGRIACRLLAGRWRRMDALHTITPPTLWRRRRDLEKADSARVWIRAIPLRSVAIFPFGVWRDPLSGVVPWLVPAGWAVRLWLCAGGVGAYGDTPRRRRRLRT